MKSKKKVFYVTAEKFSETSILADSEKDVLNALKSEDLEDWGSEWEYSVREISTTKENAEYFIDEDGYLDEIKNFVEEQEDNYHEPGKYDAELPFVWEDEIMSKETYNTYVKKIDEMIKKYEQSLNSKSIEKYLEGDEIGEWTEFVARSEAVDSKLILYISKEQTGVSVSRMDSGATIYDAPLNGETILEAFICWAVFLAL